MCGIGGILPLSKDISKKTILEIAKHLLLENQSRGRDASGIASWDLEKNEILICKQAEQASDFVLNLTEKHILGPTMIHCRAKTRGEPSDPENNHPMFGEKFCLVHNGMVPDMKELPDYKLKGQCDTEILLSCIEQFGLRDAIPMIDGSAALAIMSPENRTFYLYRHTSPLVLAYYPNIAFVFSSLEFPLKKIAGVLGVEKMWGIFTTQLMADFDEGQLFALNMDTHEVTTDNIKVETSVNTGSSCDFYKKKTHGLYAGVYD